MSYQVISRKYRPQLFDGIVGQSHISSTLRNAIKIGRIAHAYLFCGSRGIGKTTTARILAKSLNCRNSQDINPCNKCQNCIEITNGSSMNVNEIDGASNRGIDQIRELRENVKYPPVNAKYRIYIIDEVHMLTKEAFNALLKTLEEPPDHIVFIFATTVPIKIPETIISRCQRYDFHRIPVNLIVEQLKTIADMEKVSVSDDILMMIAKKAEGGMRDAESLLDQLISFSGDSIKMEDAQRILGLIDYDYYKEIGNYVLAQDQSALVNCAKDIFNKGVEVGEFLEGFSEHFRNLLITKHAGSVDMLDLPQNVKKIYKNEVEKWQSGDLLRLMKMVTEARISLKNSLNHRTHLEFNMLRMGAMEKTVTIQDILGNLETSKFSYSNIQKPQYTKKKIVKDKVVQTDAVKEDKAKSIEPLQEKKVEEETQTVEISLEKVKEKWENILNCINKTNMGVGTFLQHGEPINFENNTLEISFPEENIFHKKTVEKKTNVVESAIKNYFTSDIKIKYALHKTYTEAEKKTRVEELSNKIIDEFDGQVII